MSLGLPIWQELTLLISGVSLLAFVFAKLEINIEGEAGWAANLPTWRIDKHWLLDVFFGGRPMTGYHAWALSFSALVFHFAALLVPWSWVLECRVLASLMWFWIFEDFLWFVMNPAYGLSRFRPAHVPWHKVWLFGVPVDYLRFLVIAVGLLWFSYR